MRLAWARYYDPKLENPRAYFAERIKVVAPEVVADLRESVWPIYASQEERGHLLSWEWLQEAKAYPRLAQQVRPLEDAIISWAERYHLGREFWTVDAEWVYDAALDTLDRWELEPEALETAYFGSRRIGWDAEALETPPSPPAYDPVFDEKTEYLERVKRYMDEVERQARLVKAVDKENLQHVDWVVRYQVQGWSHAAIRDEYPKDEIELYDTSNISKSLRDTARSLGLKLRPHAPGGRPTV